MALIDAPSRKHSVGNPPVLKFLIEKGLDVDEVASRPDTGNETYGICLKHTVNSR